MNEIQKKRGRPKKELDQVAFEKLCGMQCTLCEIATFLEASEDTVESWCEETYGLKFSIIYKKFSAQGKISLRRAQFRLAEKSPTMAIFLGKQYLGQKDVEGRYGHERKVNEENKK